ncbi:MAG: DUF2249 domain-containing protein [Gammaproteobacteria bacterium]|nr:DUF2249 domain-containing protein [Gammaproteobacteria bacterium]
MAAREIELDCRDMEPPEPYECATAALRTLTPGTYLKLILPRRPELLYPWLREHGFRERTLLRAADHCEVYVCRDDDPGTCAALAART